MYLYVKYNLDFKTFQVYSSWKEITELELEANISKLFKFIVHINTIDY